MRAWMRRWLGIENLESYLWHHEGVTRDEHNSDMSRIRKIESELGLNQRVTTEIPSKLELVLGRLEHLESASKKPTPRTRRKAKR